MKAALAALGAYSGANTAAEHAAERKRLGYSEGFYRMGLANALLGVAELEALLAETGEGPEERMMIAHRQALLAAGVAGSKPLLLEFLCWRALRISLPLREIGRDPATGPVPLAAVHAAEGLGLLLGAAAAGQDLDPATFSPEVMKADLLDARDSLERAIANLDLMRPYRSNAAQAVPDAMMLACQTHGAAAVPGWFSC